MSSGASAGAAGKAVPEPRPVADGYVLVEGPPSAEEFMALRAGAGLTPVGAEQAARGIDGAWHSVHVRHGESGVAVAMGRLLGDGGTQFHLIDMATLPDHQRLGLGGAVLRALITRVRELAPGARIDLLADPPGRILYARHGFTPTDDELGMALRP